MAQPFRIGMLMLHHGTPRDQQARAHPTLPEHWRRRAGIEEFANRKLICAVAPDAPGGGFAG